jgi:adenylate kinase family enzyme
VKRISVVGSSGSGKTTLARTIAERRGIPHLELDSVYHQPNWKPLSDTDFQTAVESFVGGESWVIDGNYGRTGIQDLIWRRADAVIWLDLSRMVVMLRLFSRSARRAVTKEELWNGNTEQWSNFFSMDANRNIFLWTWQRYGSTAERYRRAMADPSLSSLEWIHLGTQSEIDDFVDRLGSDL